MIQGKDAGGVRLHWDNFDPKLRTAAGIFLLLAGLLLVYCLPHLTWLWVLAVIAGTFVSLARSELTLWPERRTYRRFVGILGITRSRTGSFDELAGWEIDRQPKTEFSGHDHTLRLVWKGGNSCYTLPSPASLYELSADAKELERVTGLPVLEGPGIQSVSATSLPHRVA